MRKVFKKKSKKITRRGSVKRVPYNLVDDLDRKLRDEDIEKYYKTLDKDGRPKPLTETQLRNIIREAIRAKWMHCPAKMAFLFQSRKEDRNPNSARLWKYTCNMCNNDFSLDGVQVDHIDGNNSFTDLSMLTSFASAILDKGGEEDLQILCTGDLGCHEIKTAMDAHGFTEEEAMYYKRATLWEKNNKAKKVSVEKQKEFLIAKGFDAKDVSNAPKRRECFIQMIRREDEKKV